MLLAAWIPFRSHRSPGLRAAIVGQRPTGPGCVDREQRRGLPVCTVALCHHSLTVARQRGLCTRFPNARTL